MSREYFDQRMSEMMNPEPVIEDFAVIDELLSEVLELTAGIEAAITRRSYLKRTAQGMLGLLGHEVPCPCDRCKKAWA